MVVLNRKQRGLLAETVRDLANVAVGAMLFGQFLADQTFSIWIATGGTCMWVGLVAFAMSLAREERS
jgi:hypothetical protein